MMGFLGQDEEVHRRFICEEEMKPSESSTASGGLQAEPAPVNSFHDFGYSVLRSLVEKRRRAFLYTYASEAARQGLLPQEDPQVPNTPSVYADPMMEALLETLLPRIEQETQLRLFPTYSYYRVYKSGDVLKKHTDRPSCEISVTVNLGYRGGEPWPLWVETNGVSHPEVLHPGDALLYRGIDIPHWREAFVGEHAVQVFLHYIDQAGPHGAWKFDQRPSLAVLRRHEIMQDK
jgi:hypothetical protein